MSCSSNNADPKSEDPKAGTQQEQKPDPEPLQGDVVKKSIVVFPCANGYDFATNGLELESAIEKSLDACGFCDAEKLSLKNLKGLNVYGLWHEKDLALIRSKITSDYFVVCRMNVSTPEPSGGDIVKDYGYRFRIYERKTGAMKGELASGVLSSFDSIPTDIARRCEHIRSILDL